MIIFGWGHQTTKNYGPAADFDCGNCKHKEFWNLYRITTWFTLFFIPVLPYSNKYMLICPICAYGIKIDGSKFHEFKALVERNNSIIDGTLVSEYNTETKQEKSKQIEECATKYCSQCGDRLRDSASFCSKCGNKV